MPAVWTSIAVLMLCVSCVQLHSTVERRLRERRLSLLAGKIAGALTFVGGIRGEIELELGIHLSPLEIRIDQAGPDEPVPVTVSTGGLTVTRYAWTGVWVESSILLNPSRVLITKGERIRVDYGSD